MYFVGYLFVHVFFVIMLGFHMLLPYFFEKSKIFQCFWKNVDFHAFLACFQKFASGNYASKLL